MKRISDKSPCLNCCSDRQIGNPYVWQSDCYRCQNLPNWKAKVIDRLAAIEDILGDDYDLDRLKELVEKDKSQKSSSVYNHLPEEGQEVWYWDSYGISKGIVEFTNDTLNEFTVDFPDEHDADIFYGCAWGDCIVASREEALEKMREGEK